MTVKIKKKKKREEKSYVKKKKEINFFFFFAKITVKDLKCQLTFQICPANRLNSAFEKVINYAFKLVT